MKTKMLLSLMLAFTMPLGAAAAAPADSLPTAGKTAQVQKTFPSVSVQKLGAGRVTTYDYGPVKMYAYSTQDPLDDQCYAFETSKGTVLLESTILKNNISEWNQFVQNFSQPIVGELMSYHPNGYAVYGKHPVYATRNAVQSWQPQGGIYAIVENLAKSFGDAADPSMPKQAQIVTPGEDVTLAGMTFHIVAAGDDAYDVEIPQIHAVYRHMMGSDVHSILASRDQIRQEIETLEGYQQKGYDLILTSHYKPEGQPAVAQKIAYLKKVQEIADSCKNREAFLQTMKENFPTYQGESYLNMTASFLYK